MSVWIGILVLLVLAAAGMFAFVMARPKEVKQWCTASHEEIVAARKKLGQ